MILFASLLFTNYEIVVHLGLLLDDAHVQFAREMSSDLWLMAPHQVHVMIRTRTIAMTRARHRGPALPTTTPTSSKDFRGPTTLGGIHKGKAGSACYPTVLGMDIDLDRRTGRIAIADQLATFITCIIRAAFTRTTYIPWLRNTSSVTPLFHYLSSLCHMLGQGFLFGALG